MSFQSMENLVELMDKIRPTLHSLREMHDVVREQRISVVKKIDLDDKHHIAITITGPELIFRIFAENSIILKFSLGYTAVVGKLLRFWSSMVYWNGSEDNAQIGIYDASIPNGEIFSVPLDEAKYFQRSLVVELPDVSVINTIQDIRNELNLPSSRSFNGQVYVDIVDYIDADAVNAKAAELIGVMLNEVESCNN